MRLFAMSRNLSALLIGFIALSGCPKERLTRVLPPDVRVDTYLQQSASKVDVLWVVDNSGSMAPRQENLAKNFQAFIDIFSKGSIDFRIGVTTTDIFKLPGQLRGTPRVLTPQTPSLASAFANNIKVGIAGSPYEAGLQSAQLVLDAYQRANADKQAAISNCKAACANGANNTQCQASCETAHPIEFLRPDAYLYLIFVSDEEDESSQDVRSFWRSYETAKGIGNDGTVTTAAIVGEDPNTCGATPGSRYKALSTLTGGDLGSICDADFAKTLKKLATSAVGLKRKFALARPPNLETLEVHVKYPCNAAAEVIANCASVDREDCVDAPGDALSLICSPPQGGPDGWTYEKDNQSVFFAGDSVPGLHAQVDLQYYEEGKGP
jgi:hypothetical protein